MKKFILSSAFFLNTFFALLVYASSANLIDTLATEILQDIKENAIEYEKQGYSKNVYYDLVRADFLTLAGKIDKGINDLKNTPSSGNVETSTGVDDINTCKWKYHPVIGPVGTLDIDLGKTSCTKKLSGLSAYELSGNKQKVATCECAGEDTGTTYKPVCSWGATFGPCNPGVCSPSNIGTQACGGTCECVGNIYGSGNSNKVGTVYMSNIGSNDLSKPNGTVDGDKQWYVMLDGVDKSNPPKGCARLANNTAGCTKPSDFRDYTPNEWVTPTRISSGGPTGVAPNTFPVGKYEFFSLYDGKIYKVGYGELIEGKPLCSWGATFGPCNPGVCSPSNIGAQACGGTCACY